MNCTGNAECMFCKQVENADTNHVQDSEHHKPKIIGGDFNTWPVEWGTRKTNNRGRILLEAFVRFSIGKQWEHQNIYGERKKLS